jgi:pyrroline-5-carboxylate reductase
MKKVGFIGYGSMGQVIINAFINSEALKPDQIIISTRTTSKLDNIKKTYPEIDITPDNPTTALKSNLIFLFVGTLDVIDVIEEIIDKTTKNTHIVYISAALDLKMVNNVFNGKITKVMPSLTSEIYEGVSLICHNSEVTDDESEYVNSLFSAIGDYKIVDEVDFDVGADITSCAPAFIAKIFMEFAYKASLNSGFTNQETEQMVIKTLYGTSKLLNDKNLGFNNLISSVATKGGITEEGIKILDDKMPEIFDDLFKKTIEKHEIIKRELEEQY